MTRPLRWAADLIIRRLEATTLDPEGAVSTADLHRAHKAWSQRHGEPPTSQRALTTLVVARGFKQARLRLGGRQLVRAVLGLRLRGTP